ncbi:MAG: DNA polymerase III subunit epsilon [Chlamydiae bacterium]|nr:DNA polymerase III subunit epsilon [Chlamydiota bacterium]
MHRDTFICLDCESTGLDIESDAIIELAAVKFTLQENLDSYESLIDPGRIIPEESIKIHHITNEMVQGKPKIKDVLPFFLRFIGDHIIVGHGIKFDIDILNKAAKNNQIPCHLEKQKTIDTLRLARLYGQTPVNSLDVLRQHFNIVSEGAHRAMNDVLVNIEVFKHLSKSFKTTSQLLQRLEKPIAMKNMPLGKFRGRVFADIPSDYLNWAANQNFDQDLLFSIRSELKKRKNNPAFSQAANPFSSL